MSFIFEGIDSEESPKNIDFIFEGIEKKPDIKAEQIAKSLKFYGLTPSSELIEKIRKPTGIALKEFTSGLLGTPGDILNFLNKLTKKEETYPILPTSEEIGRFFETAAKEEFKPETTSEEYIGNTAGFLGSILGTGGPLAGGTAAKSLGRTALAAIVPSAVATATEKAELPSWMRVTSTIGSALLTHRVTGKSLKSINKELYEKATSLSKNKLVKTASLERNLDKLETTLKKGVSTPPKTAIKTVIGEIRSKIKNGEIPVEELMEAKRNINERVGEFFNIKGSKNLFKNAGKIVDIGLQEFEKTNPEFKQAFRQANSMFKGLNETKAVERFLIKHPVLTGEAFLLKKFLGPIFTGKSIGVAASVKGIEFLLALSRNPGLRKAYNDILKNAAKNEVRGTLNSLKKFNKKIEKENPELLENI
jgi:hypothetical protein